MALVVYLFGFQVTVGGKEFFTPCESEDEGAISMSWKNVPQKQLREPKCEAEDVHNALSKVKPSVSQEDIDKAKEWTEMFGKIDRIKRFIL
jgi:vacuolar protein-sorting-associated protein 4